MDSKARHRYIHIVSTAVREPVEKCDGLSSFLSPRGGSNYWAQSEENIRAWRNQALEAVHPITLEFAPVLDCNSNCPLCPYRSSRIAAHTTRWLHGEFAKSNGTTVATREDVRNILRASARAGVRGVLWTGGGEPTLFEPLIESFEQSAELGMVNALYTNGFLIGVRQGFADRVFSPKNALVFVRVSVNALSADPVRAIWGIDDPNDIRFQLNGLRELLLARERAGPVFRAQGRAIPSVQISTIVNSSNLGDLLSICTKIAELFESCRKTIGPEDVMVVRPTINDGLNGYMFDQHPAEVIEQMVATCRTGGPGWSRLASAGVPLYLGFALDQIEQGTTSIYPEVLRNEYAQRDVSWAHGLFLTVGPDASVYPCMELNCNKNWVLGNLKDQSVQEIYHSIARRKFLEMANRMRWGPGLFHPFFRSVRLDRIAKAIISGHLSQREINVIRAESLRSHTLLLN
jgi:MoaA/NifB/PqqE/SkfB family radical SAM enzyme